MPRRRYAILHHTGVVTPHFDVMIEVEPGGPLATWRFPAWPIASPTPVVRLADHRRDYLTYEGPVSGGRGTVARVDGGSCEADVAPSGAWVLRVGNATLSLRQIDQHAWLAEAGAFDDILPV